MTALHSGRSVFRAVSAPPPPPPSGPNATAFAISGQAQANTGQFVVLTVVPVGGPTAAAGTVSLSAPGLTLSSTALSFAAGATAGQTVTATTSVEGSYAVTMTNSLGLTNTGSPLSVTFAAALAEPSFEFAGVYTLALSPTSYTLGWPRVKGATEYQYSLDDGATWASAGDLPYASVTGRTAGATDVVRVRAINPSGVDEITGSVVLPAAGAASVVVSTIGPGGTYATPADWELATRVNLVVANIIHEGWVLPTYVHTSVYGQSACDIRGATVGAGRYRHLTAFPGASFVDHEDRRTNPLRYDATKGSAISNEPGVDDQDRMTIDLREGYARVTRLQVRSTGNGTTKHGGYAIHTSTSIPVWVDQCILQTGSAKFTWSAYGPHLITNSLVICDRPVGASQVLAVGEMGVNGSGGGSAYNVQFISLHQVATRATASENNTSVFRNCGFWNCVSLDNAQASNPVYENCFTNATGTLRTGCTLVALDTGGGSGFESVTPAALDLRLRGTSALRASGAINSANPKVDITNSLRPVGTAPDVGPWQTPPAGSAPAVASLTTFATDQSRMVTFRDYLDGTPYERFQDLTLYTGSSATVRIRGWHPTASGGSRALLAGTYRLLVDDIERATVAVTAGVSTSAQFTLDLTSIAEGWHWLKCEPVGAATGETCPPWPVYVQKGSAAVAQATMPITTASFALISEKQPYRYGTVPAAFTPTLVPYPARTYPEEGVAYTRAQMVQGYLVPWRRQDTYRTQRSVTGVVHSFNHQAYFWDSMRAQYPGALASIDGPRGQAVVSMVTHLQVGRNGKVYGLDPWRFFKIQPNGEVQTLAGWRHKSPFTVSANPLDDLELVGDWSAVPANRRGFHEAWGLAWDTRTLATAPPAIPNDENGLTEEPHTAGPTAFISDTQNNRIVKIVFSPTTHSAPGVVSEFITGLDDPWDIVFSGSSLYITERKQHRIVEYSADTGAFIRTVIGATASLSALDQNRVPKLNAGQTLSAVQAQACQLPEGLYLHQGWLYWAALIQRQVRRINLTTNVTEVVQSFNVDSNSKFAKIAVSDGTFYPAGTVFVCNWGVFNYGYPQGLNVGVNSAGHGPGLPWQTLGYPSAVAVGQGRLVCGSSSEGVIVVSKALAGDATINSTQWAAWNGAWLNGGYKLTHGHFGFGFYGLSLPWGVSSDIDNFLTACGHTAP